MRGDDLGDLVFGEAGREMFCRCKMAGLALVAGERLVGDVADEVLEKTVLAVLGRTRVGLQRQDLLAHEGDEQRLDVLLGSTGKVRECRPGEGLAQDGAVLKDTPFVRREPVQPCGDERVQRLGHIQCLDLPGRAVHRTLLHEQRTVEQHAHRLDRVKRHTLGAGEDLRPQSCWQTGHEAGEQLLHRLLRERLEEERGEVAVAGTPGRPTLEQFGPGERDHVERMVSRPLEQVLDEVEEGAVRPLHVLEGEHGRVLVGETLEEEAPRSEQVLPVARLVVAEPEQLREPRLDVPLLVLVEDVLVERRAQLA